MADDDDDDFGEDEEEGAGGGKLMLIIGLVNTVGLLALAAYVVLVMGNAPEQTPEQMADQAMSAQEKSDRASKTAVGPMIELGVIVVNLREPTGDRYLKTKIQLELDSEETRAEVEGRLSQIRYQLNILLAGKRVADVQGPESIEAIRQTMIRRANAVLAKGRIVGVWPDEWIVQ